jgi:hypothetical protein
MTRPLAALICLAIPAGAARAQDAALDPPLSRIYRAPGFYGTAWGNASYGVPRLYSNFGSNSGVNYGLGYDPYRILPGRFGRGLWTDAAGPGDWGGGYLGYRTFVHPPTPGLPNPGIGHYAPQLGPPFLVGESLAR